MTRDLYPQPDEQNDPEQNRSHSESYPPSPTGDSPSEHKTETEEKDSKEPRLLDRETFHDTEELKPEIDDSLVTTEETSTPAFAPHNGELSPEAGPVHADPSVPEPEPDDIQVIDTNSEIIRDLLPQTPEPNRPVAAPVENEAEVPKTELPPAPPEDHPKNISSPPEATISEPDEKAASPVSPVSSFSLFKAKHKTALWLFIPILLALLTGFILSTIYPEIISLMTRALVTIVIVIFIVFITLGILVVVGLRDQARSLLSLIFEGGVRYIDFAQTLSEIWETVIRIVQEFILLISPFLAVFLAAIFYYIVMFSFRAVGAHNDVTIFTIVMTIFLASITAGLGQIKIADSDSPASFKSQLSIRFSRVFIDSVEIAVLIIFLTIDANRLFFLPESLQKPIEAQAFGIDFMKRGITGDGFSTTFRIAGAAVFVEVIRKIYRVIFSTYSTFKKLRKEIEAEGRQFSSQKEAFQTLKRAAQLAFKDNIDDFMKFLGFTTILVVAFFLFPRLKLLSLLVFNLTNLAWDIIIPARATKKGRSEDLLSRTIAKVLRL